MNLGYQLSLAHLCTLFAIGTFTTPEPSTGQVPFLVVQFQGQSKSRPVYSFYGDVGAIFLVHFETLGKVLASRRGSKPSPGGSLSASAMILFSSNLKSLDTSSLVNPLAKSHFAVFLRAEINIVVYETKGNAVINFHGGNGFKSLALLGCHRCLATSNVDHKGRSHNNFNK
jgi:hypothetical protein